MRAKMKQKKSRSGGGGGGSRNGSKEMEMEMYKIEGVFSSAAGVHATKRKKERQEQCTRPLSIHAPGPSQRMGMALGRSAAVLSDRRARVYFRRAIPMLRSFSGCIEQSASWLFSGADCFYTTPTQLGGRSR